MLIIKIALIFSIFQIRQNSKIKLNRKESPKHYLYSNNYLNNYDEEDVITLNDFSDITIDIYTIITAYIDKIPIPADRYQIYKIESGSSGTYRVVSGKSVTVGKDGIIYPKNLGKPSFLLAESELKAIITAAPKIRTMTT